MAEITEKHWAVAGEILETNWYQQTAFGKTTQEKLAQFLTDAFPVMDMRERAERAAEEIIKKYNPPKNPAFAWYTWDNLDYHRDGILSILTETILRHCGEGQ